jgi:uncharacterized protein YqgC (DUF456 family)
MYFVWVTLLAVANAGGWLANSFGLPGNWLIVAFTAVFAYFVPEDAGRGITGTGVSALVGLALVGEGLEFFAGALGVSTKGGSRRGVLMAIAGTIVGSLLGAVVASPIPIIGPIIGALGGGAAGAFAGAWIGEIWKGKSLHEGFEIGKGALLGRILGTTGKLIVGALMIVFALVDSLI